MEADSVTTGTGHGNIFRRIADKIGNEARVFRESPFNMRILLITNMLYSFVLPVVELFIGAYIMRNSSNTVLVVCFQLASYTGVPITFMLNGFLLRIIPIKWLYAFGMLLSGISMMVMMSLHELTFAGIVPYVVGAFIAASPSIGIEDINTAYRIVTAVVFAITITSSIVVFRGRFTNPEKSRFIYWHFDRLWNRMMSLAALKGIAQGYIVTAPAMLIMSLVGNEGTLGTIQSCGAILSALVLYVLGRFSTQSQRVAIFAVGLGLFAFGGLVNAVLYSSAGVIIFMLCLVMGRPLMDLAYFPIQLRVIDYVQGIEKRNSFSYIFVHEFGLYFGRFCGCGLFLIFALCISEGFALRYALLIIGLVQLLSVYVASDINRTLDKVS